MAQTEPQTFGSDDGAILIAVAWIVLILSLMAVGVLALTLTARQSVAAQEQELTERLIAESAVDIFMHRLFYDPVAKVYENGTLEVLGRTVDITVQYESAKVNLNHASETLLSAMFISQGVTEEKALALAAAIADWRDTDSDTRADGAEAEAYAAAGKSYGPRNGPFESVGEFQYVLGMDRDTFYCFRPLVTVYYSLKKDIHLDWEQAEDRVFEILEWAYEQKWQDADWPTPEDLTKSESVAGSSDDTLAGQGMTLLVSLRDTDDAAAPPSIYRTMVRYKNSLSYRTVSAPALLTEEDSADYCPAG